MSEGNSIDLEKAEQIGTVTVGMEYFDDFLIDSVLSFNDGTENLNYHIYIPEAEVSVQKTRLLWDGF